MEISIQKGTTVSLHEQLVTQISMQIAAGILKPGAKLPSIRALSQKLGIHHNTCLNAYKELEKNGLIHIRHGSGIRVATTDQDDPLRKLSPTRQEPIELEQVAAFFVQQVMRGGHSWDAALAALNQARQQQRTQVRQPLVVVDIHADILPVFQAELQHALNRPVEKALLSQLDAEAERHSHFVVSRYHYQTLKDQLKAHLGKDLSETQLAERMRVIDVGAVRQELDLIRQLPVDALVTVVSGSTIILQQAEAVIKALRGEDVYIRTILSGHETQAELQRVLKRSQVIFADWLCLPQLQALTRKPVHLVRTIPEHELEKLKTFQG
jgi:DNA-binding transcriptional regulator YhcF (GntR family)